MTIVYVLISVILGVAIGHGMAWVIGFVELRNLSRTASKVIAKELVMAPPVAPEPPRTFTSEYLRGRNDTLLEIAVDMERAGNKVLAWQIRKRIKT